MDTPDIETAKNVWRWNLSGLGHSSNGYDGPYPTAITQDGAIVADFITAGTMLADRIRAGKLLSVDYVEGEDGAAFDLDKNEIVFYATYGEKHYAMIFRTTSIRIMDVNNPNDAIYIVFGDVGSMISIQSWSGGGMSYMDSEGLYACDYNQGAIVRRISITRSGIKINGDSGVQDGKSGRAVFSDGSYMDFTNGILTGGQTASGGQIT